MMQFGHKPGGFFLNDPLCRGALAVALFAVPFASLPKVVQAIQVHAQALADRRLEVSRHRQVKDEHRPLCAGRFNRLEAR